MAFTPKLGSFGVTSTCCGCSVDAEVSSFSIQDGPGKDDRQRYSAKIVSVVHCCGGYEFAMSGLPAA